MCTRTRGPVVAALTALAVLVSLAACTGKPDCAAGPGSTASADVGDHNEQGAPAGQRGVGSLPLGDLNKPKSAGEVGAPFDPCGLSWTDFPAGVRPSDGTPHTPTARPAGPDDPYELRCVYDNSGAITLDREGNSTGPAGGMFLVSVVWGATKLNADPRKRKGAIAKSWNNRAGLVATFTDPKHGKACLGLVTLSTGVAGVSVTNSRFRNVDPCAVVDSLLTAVTAKAT